MRADLSRLTDDELETKLAMLRDAYRYGKGEARDKALREMNDCRDERNRRLPDEVEA